jgi:hypothetical protein
MRPKQPETTRSGDLFRARLDDQIINLKHEQLQFAGQFDWDFIDGEIAAPYGDKGGIRTWFAIGRLLLPFTGEEIFQHERPDESHWKKRRDDKLELLVAESLRVAQWSGRCRARYLKWVTVDSTGGSSIPSMPPRPGASASAPEFNSPAIYHRTHRRECRQNGDTHAGTVTAPRQHASGPAPPWENGGV